jgi:hypothetical protein
MPGSPYPHILGYFKPEIARLIYTFFLSGHFGLRPNDPFTTTCNRAIAMPARTRKCVKYYTKKHFSPEKTIQKQLIAPLSRYSLKTQTHTPNCPFKSTQMKHTNNPPNYSHRQQQQQQQKRIHRYLSPD